MLTTARQLHVRLEFDGVERFRLALPPSAAERLSFLMPPQVAEEAQENGIDLYSIEATARGGDLSPRTLVDYTTHEGRHIAIWLE